MSLVAEIQRFEREESNLINNQTLHILNGQEMLKLVKEQQLLLGSPVVAFNEAMCMHRTSTPIFDDEFNQLRAKGHQSTLKQYQSIVLEPLNPLFEASFHTAVLWFGEDMFCQMNVLTLLAFLEQQGRSITVYVVSFDENIADKISWRQLDLGKFQTMYRQVLMKKRKPIPIGFSVLDQAINDYLLLQEKENPITKWIKANQQLSENQMIAELMQQFSFYGFGDVQYQAFIREVKNSAQNK